MQKLNEALPEYSRCRDQGRFGVTSSLGTRPQVGTSALSKHAPRDRRRRQVSGRFRAIFYYFLTRAIVGCCAQRSQTHEVTREYRYTGFPVLEARTVTC